MTARTTLDAGGLIALDRDDRQVLARTDIQGLALSAATGRLSTALRRPTALTLAHADGPRYWPPSSLIGADGLFT